MIYWQAIIIGASVVLVYVAVLYEIGRRDGRAVEPLRRRSPYRTPVLRIVNGRDYARERLRYQPPECWPEWYRQEQERR